VNGAFAAAPFISTSGDALASGDRICVQACSVGACRRTWISSYWQDVGRLEQPFIDGYAPDVATHRPGDGGLACICPSTSGAASECTKSYVYKEIMDGARGQKAKGQMGGQKARGQQGRNRRFVPFLPVASALPCLPFFALLRGCLSTKNIYYPYHIPIP